MNKGESTLRWLAVVALIGLVSPAAAQIPEGMLETGPLLVGCRSFIENDPTGNVMQMGACAGAVNAVLQVSRTTRRACPPPEMGVIEAMRAVVQFSDERAERRSGPFGPMALSAIGDRWPC